MEDALTQTGDPLDSFVVPRTRVLRVCLDLNVYCANLLGLRKGHRDTAAQELVNAVRQGASALGPVQLIVSWGMLDRLRNVLLNGLDVPRAEADDYLGVIAGFAALGPGSEPPHLTLGGTGLLTLRDTEDAHVLEVAVAGRADLLVTSNFKDFVDHQTDVRVPDRVAVHSAPHHSVVIVHTFTAAKWLREGLANIP